jgi:hypothetical protein
VPEVFALHLVRALAALNRLAALATRGGSIPCLDARQGDYGTLHPPRRALVICSPPFANRLDYTRLYAPELVCLEALGERTPRPEEYVGSNQLRRDARAPESGFLADALDQLRKSGRHGAARYYAPYFSAYGADLRRLGEWIDVSGSRGSSIVLRDVVVGSIRLRFGRFLASELRKRGFQVQTSERKIRVHIGQSRGAQYEQVIRARR